MGPLRRLAAPWAAAFLLSFSCTSLPAPSPPAEPLPLPPGLGAVLRASALPETPDATLALRPSELPSPLDLEHWPFGWVRETRASSRLGLTERFWSNQKPLWTIVLDSHTSLPIAARRLQEIVKKTSDPEEAFRAEWRLWEVHSQAGLAEDARFWLDQAAARRPGPVPSLERAWDQLYRLGDGLGARALWSAGPWANADDERKARLLRQRLFLGTKSLSPIGADDFVSTLALDRDDLWAGTWNGAVVRWSMTTGELDLIQGAGATVAPVKLLCTTGWFVYVFQEQSLLRYSKVTGAWRTFPYPKGWTGLRIQSVVVRGEQSLWVATLGQGLWTWEEGEWAAVPEGSAGPFLNALSDDGRGGLLVGTKDRGLWQWDGASWMAVPAIEGRAPTNISVIQGQTGREAWAIGTWGEGTWVLDHGRLSRASSGNEYVTSAAWTAQGPLWGTLDEGLVTSAGRLALGPLDGLPPGGVGSLVVWQDRWVWGTSGQGLGWWSEYEDSALFR